MAFDLATAKPASSSIDWFTQHNKEYTAPLVSLILLGSSEESQKQEGRGGYSDHASRRDSGPNIFFARDALNISGTINKQMVPAIVLGRWPNIPPSYWPMFGMEASEEKDRMQEVQIYGATSEKVPVPVNDFYDAAGIRKPDPGEDVIGGPAQPPTPIIPNQPGMPALEPDQDHPGHIPGRNPNAASPVGNANLGNNILGAKPMERPFPRQTGMPRNPVGVGLNGGQHARARS